MSDIAGHDITQDLLLLLCDMFHHDFCTVLFLEIFDKCGIPATRNMSHMSSLKQVYYYLPQLARNTKIFATSENCIGFTRLDCCWDTVY